MKKTSSVKSPKGFLFSAAEAAIKKPGRSDVALVLSEAVSVIAGAFTTNRVKAAPVLECRRKIRSGRGQAILVNSGNANACTGSQGIRDARLSAAAVARRLGIRPHLVYPCSTGVIGVPLPMDRMLPCIDLLAGNPGTASLGDVARTIMTTDTFPKISHREVRIGTRNCTIAGICKGAGMIAPDMATMLCFILTDIAIEHRALQNILKHGVAGTFNRITVDGDMSTNDTVLIMSSGAAGNSPVTEGSKFFAAVRREVESLMDDLARMVVRDGEGATKIIEVTVIGAPSRKAAEKCAFTVANSNLFKTAMYGNDANWGRIMAALGRSGVSFREEKTDIYFNKVRIVSRGRGTGADREAHKTMKGKEVRVKIDLHGGRASASVLTCDFSEEYVRINAEYRT